MPQSMAMQIILPQQLVETIWAISHSDSLIFWKPGPQRSAKMFLLGCYMNALRPFLPISLDNFGQQVVQILA